jgi:MoxR-like ATPase
MYFLSIFVDNLSKHKGQVRDFSMEQKGKKIEELLTIANDVILGKERALKLCLCAILARGHLLIEDVPGVGKTTLVYFWAKILGLPVTRIQLTSDLLPADIIGNLIYNKEKNKFEIYKGPIFTNLVLADELNRATPKTQSAFLQAMEEGVVSIDNQSLELPRPFCVFATQNPKQQIGTFLLPESQLDRFLMKIQIGFPEEKFEKKLLASTRRRDLIKDLEPRCTIEEILQMQKAVQNIHASEAIIDYVEKILQKGRTDHAQWPGVGEIHGPSPRAGMAMLEAARAWAFIHGRDYLMPSDIQEIAVEVLAHRMIAQHHFISSTAQNIVRSIVQSIAVM